MGEYLDNGSNSRDDKWTESIAVGSPAEAGLKQ